MQQTQQQAASQQKQQKTVSSNTTVNSSTVTNVTSKTVTTGKTKTWTVQVCSVLCVFIFFSFIKRGLEESVACVIRKHEGYKLPFAWKKQSLITGTGLGCIFSFLTKSSPEKSSSTREADFPFRGKEKYFFSALKTKFKEYCGVCFSPMVFLSSIIIFRYNIYFLIFVYESQQMFCL